MHLKRPLPRRGLKLSHSKPGCRVSVLPFFNTKIDAIKRFPILSSFRRLLFSVSYSPVNPCLPGGERVFESTIYMSDESNRFVSWPMKKKKTDFHPSKLYASLLGQSVRRDPLNASKRQGLPTISSLVAKGFRESLLSWSWLELVDVRWIVVSSKL
jgi:hypothetical protein